MVAVFIQLTSKDSMVIEEVKQEAKQTLNAMDRCDSCGAQAYVMVKGITGELLFCSHHYNKIMDNPVGYEKMMGFMLEVVDETDRLVENRLKDN
jgi:5-bromo-4-chloroindolyl phosphate hydrolysis protein